MARVTIYTKQGCPFSARARELLDEKGIPFDEIDVTDSPDKRAEMERVSCGRTSTPQILVDGEPLGGADDLDEADRAGRLATLLIADQIV